MTLRILALSPYHGGSHAQFLEGWQERSRHSFSVMTLPPRHFKWRIRQASVGMAANAQTLARRGESFDVIWTTSMMDVAEFRGLLPRDYSSLPLVAYFHENQLVYPVRKEDERNQHFSLINWASALSADEVWFNSAFNRDSMRRGLEQLLRKMPDENCLASLDVIDQKCAVEPLGVARISAQNQRPGPLHIGWVARWEHDKRPDRFFSALAALRARGIDFRLTVLGQSFRSWPQEFDQARHEFENQIVHFGFTSDRSEYESQLSQCDVVVSTAEHEFLGVALLEACSAGAIVLAPNRLVYPELYPQGCRYDDEQQLLTRLEEFAEEKRRQKTLLATYARLDLAAVFARFDFDARAPDLDNRLDSLVARFSPSRR